jgi:adenylate cyclase
MLTGQEFLQCKPKARGLLALSFAALSLVLVVLLQPLETSWGRAALFYWRGHLPAPPQVVIASLNQQVAEELAPGKSLTQFPREIHAQLINALSAAQARVIVFDIAFKSPRDTNADQALAAAIQASGRVVLFDYLKRYQVPAGGGWADVEERLEPIGAFKSAALGSGFFVLPKYPQQVFNTELIQTLQGTPCLAQPLQVMLHQQPDPWRALQRQLLPQLPPSAAAIEQTFLALLHSPASAWPALKQAAPELPWKSLEQLAHQQGQWAINFYGPAGHLTQWPIDQLLRMPAAQLQALVADKIVYVGVIETLQTEQVDTYRTVYSSRAGIDLSGVEISATVTANLLAQEGLRSLSPVMQWLLLLVLGAPWWCLAGRWSLRPLLLSTLAAYGIYTLAVAAGFYYGQLHLPAIAPLSLAAATLLWQSGWALRQHRVALAAVTQALQQYVPPEAAAKVGQQIADFAAQHRLVSGVALLTDIQGYTRLAETLPADELHRLMNRYYALLVDEVAARGGIVANIVGDALLALWLDTRVSQEVCQRALETAFAIQARLQQDPELGHQLPTSCALHAGEFSLGHLGAQGHFEYSPVGDVVNTCSRVEPLNRTLGTQMLCTAPVAQALLQGEPSQPAPWRLRLLGAFALRNKREPVELYQVKHSPAGDTGEEERLECLFSGALQQYTRNSQEAAGLFQAILAEFPQDGPSKYYAQQTAQG